MVSSGIVGHMVALFLVFKESLYCMQVKKQQLEPNME